MIHKHTEEVLPYYLYHSAKHKGINFINASNSEEFLAYDDLLEKSLIVLKNLQDLELREGDEIIFQIQNNKHFLVIFWACVLGKFIPVPLSVSNANNRDQRLMAIWKMLNNPHLITDLNRPYVDLLGVKERKIINLHSLYKDNGGGKLTNINKDDIAYIQFSSGSSGNPKGVELTHQNVCINALDIINSSESSDKDSSLCWMPLTHDMGMIGFHISSLVGNINQHIIPTEVFIRRPKLWISKASEHKVTTLYSPNFGFKYFLSALGNDDNADWDLSTIRIIYNGAEPILHSLCDDFIEKLKKFGLRERCILTVYGLAEASVAVSIPKVGEPIKSYNVDRRNLALGQKIKFLSSPNDPNSANFIMVGYPLPNCQVRIANVDIELENCHIGEIQIKGKNVTQKYYNNTEETKTSFTSDGWLKTGDLGFINKKELIITGRSKNIIIVNGQNYYPHDLEKISYSIDRVELGKIAFCGIPDHDNRHDTVVAFLIFRKSIKEFIPLLKSIKHKLSTEIGIQVDKIIPINRIPKTTSGKVQYFRLKEDYQSGKFDDIMAKIDELFATSADKSLSVKEQVIKVVKSIVSSSEISANDNLFSVGLNSLQALEFCSRINDLLNTNISVTDIFDHNTINDLVEVIKKQKQKTSVIIGKSKSSCEVLPIQRRFWLLHEMDNEDTDSMFNITTSIQIKGELNTDLLQNAFEAVLKRHKVLGYTFKMYEQTLQFEVNDLNINEVFFFVDETSNEQLINFNVQDILTAKFNLARGPLCRLVLHKKSEDTYGLTLQLHHVIADGWSVKVIISDLLKYYSAIKKGNVLNNVMPDLTFQFGDYIDWIENELKENSIYKAYWVNELEKFQDFDEELPFVKKVQLKDKIKTNQVNLKFKNSLFDKLKLYAESNNVTIYVALVTCLNILLYKYTSEINRVISIVSAGRGNTSLINQVGCYIKLLPLLITIDPSESFTDMIKRVKCKVKNGLENDVYSYDRLKEDLIKTFRDKIRLSDITVLMQDFDTILNINEYSKNLEITEVKQVNEGSVSKMQFEFVIRNGELSLKLNFNEGLFHKSDMKNIVKHFETLLISVLEKPDESISSYNFLNEKEQQKILSFSKPYEFESSNTSIIELFDRQVRKSPHKTAVVCNDVQLTYQQLYSYSNKIAVFLKDRWNVTSEQVVVLAMSRTHFLVASILGVLRAGAAYLPIDLDYPEERVRHMLNISEANNVLIDFQEAEYKSVFLNKNTVEIQALINGTGTLLFEKKYPNLDDRAYIIFTSGTTGFPKGMGINHRALVDYVETFNSYFDVSKDDTFVQQASIAFDTMVEEVFPILTKGGKLVISENGGKYIDELVALIRTENVSVLSTTPAVINELNKLKEVPQLRTLISGGDELKPFHVDRLINHLSIYNTYGPSESTVCATYNKVKSLSETNVIGSPIRNRVVLLLNNDKQTVPLGCIGEIFIGGVGLTTGYLNYNENINFLESTYFEGESLYKSGDIGKWLSNGKVEFCGRKDNQLKINGYRIEVYDIENNLKQIEDIDDVAVVSKEIANDRKILVAFYVSKLEISPDGLRNLLRNKIPFFMIPSRFIRLQQLPITINGKVDRKALVLLEYSSYDDHESNLPLNDIEETLLDLWKEEFRIDDISVYSNFFELGGHSIMAVQCINQIHRIFNTQISLKQFFTAPSIRALSTIIRNTDDKTHESIKQAVHKDYYDLSPSQKGIWLLNELEGDTIGYNIFGAFELSGELHVPNLQKAFRTIIHRHESLRTNFVKIGIDPKQVINEFDEKCFDVLYLDFSKVADPKTSLATFLKEQKSFKFDLKNWPLIKVSLVRISEKNHVLAVVMHHLAGDGISASILMNEFLSIYQTLHDKKEILLGKPKLQYRDYVEWLSSSLEHNNGIYKDFWTSKLKEPRQELDLPIDRPRSSYKSYQGAQVKFHVDSVQVDALEQFFKKHEVTFYSGFLTLVKVLLFKYTLNEDIIIGGPSIGRHHNDLNQLIGCFVNTLIVRTHIKKSDSFIEVLKKVKKNVLESFDYSNYPFEMILDDLGVKRNLRRSPLFDVRFIYDEGELQTRSFEEEVCITRELKIKKIFVPVTRSIYDLTFSFSRKENMMATIEFNSQLFDKETIELMCMRLEKLINEILKNEFLTLNEIDLELLAKDNSEINDSFDVKEAF